MTPLDPGHVRIEPRRVADLRPAEYNPRAMDEAERAGLEGSLERFGLVQPPVWNQRTGRLVGGHQRFEWVLAQGADEVDVVVVDLSEDDELALNVTLNNPHIAGRFTDALAGLIEEQREANASLYGTLRFDVLALRFSTDGDTQGRPGAEELDLRDFDVFDHRCAKCDFEWNE